MHTHMISLGTIYVAQLDSTLYSSLLPRPPPLLPNTRELKTGVCSRVLLRMQAEGKNGGGLGTRLLCSMSHHKQAPLTKNYKKIDSVVTETLDMLSRVPLYIETSARLKNRRELYFRKASYAEANRLSV